MEGAREMCMVEKEFLFAKSQLVDFACGFSRRGHTL